MSKQLLKSNLRLLLKIDNKEIQPDTYEIKRSVCAVKLLLNSKSPREIQDTLAELCDDTLRSLES